MEKKKPRLTSATLVIHEDKFLLARRNKENYKDFWVIPGGGVKYGETISDAAVREIKEETNLDIEVEKFIGFHEIVNVAADYHTIIFFHIGKVKDIDNLKASEDISDVKFFTIEEIKEIEHLAESAKWALKTEGFW